MKLETINNKQETENRKIRTGKALRCLRFQVYGLKLKSAYTLIEFLIVISILSLSVGSILLFLTSTIKGANQANITAEVKQNGQSVLDNLQSQIRSSSSVRALSGSEILEPSGYDGQSGVWLTLSTGEKLTILCLNTLVSTNNGWIGVAKQLSTALVPESIIGNFQTLTNTNAISGVDIECTATSFQVNTNSNLVIIDFKANQGKQAPSRADYLAKVQFKTTIALRVYQ